MANTNQYWDFKPEVFVSKDQGQIELFVRGEGPPLILLHELPGLAEKTFDLGDYFVKAGFKVILPLLFGKAGDDNTLVGFAKICIRQELRDLWMGKDTRIVHLIQELAQRESKAANNTGVGVVGMCLTGNMVLALLLKDHGTPSPITAPVMAQPSSSYSAPALAAVKRGDIARPVLALRFDKDWICSRTSFNKLEQAFETCPAANGQRLIVRELEGNKHSTLIYHYKPSAVDVRTKETIDARKEVVSFLKQQI
jgi:dienelactone hydrolase